MKRFRAADVQLAHRASSRAGEPQRDRAAPAPSFDGARRALHEMLEPLTFVRVISVGQATARAGGTSTQAVGSHCPTFFGEAEEVSASMRSPAHKPGKRVFFSSFARQNGIGFSLGGCATLIDAPLGSEHISSMPTVGSILVGSAVASAKAKARCPFELRGWCSNARPLMELHRVVQFGTRGGESETRQLVRQAAADTATEFARALQAAGSEGLTSIAPHQRRACTAAASVADELDCLARIVLYGRMDCLLTDPPPRLGGRSPREFAETLALVLREGRIMEEFVKVAPPQFAAAAYLPMLPPPALANPSLPPPAFGALSELSKQPYMAYGMPVYRTGGGGQYASPPRAALNADANKTPPYEPRSPQYMPSSPDGGRTPTGKATSFVPSSPPYAPQSPAYAPQSPAYAPQSPAYAPQSPAYAPPSPESGEDKPDPSAAETAHSILSSAIQSARTVDVRSKL